MLSEIDRRELQKLARIELSKRDFWEYCKFVAPDFYTDNRPFLQDLCQTLQNFYEDKERKILVINLPPRHGKSRTATLLVQWLFGKDPSARVMTGSYNETLSSTFARQVRDKILEDPTPGITVYRDIFPDTKIKKGEASVSKWALHGTEQTSYLATSPGGTATGFGCFVGETKVLTQCGEKTIREIHESSKLEKVISYNLGCGDELRLNAVIATRRLESSEIVKVKTKRGREIICTDDHRFWTCEYGWLRADELKKDHTLIECTLGKWSRFVSGNDRVESVESLDGSQDVYDIQVDRDENFFANGVLVHNCSIMLLDDIIRNAEEAYNEMTLQKHIDWFNNTMLSRTETGFKMIVIMTRWATGDLAGYILDHFDDVQHINYKAVQDDGSMLCEDILTKEDYAFKTKNMNPDIVEANYQQEPIDVKGRLYTNFKTYTGELPDFREIRNYTDTADTGADYLCSITYGVTMDKEAYVLDVLYTKDPMEVTEPALARMLVDGDVNIADIESNNGGRGFSRSVERIVRTELGSNYTIFKPFTQRKNKVSRILTNSTWVMEHVYFPKNWQEKWPEYHQAMTKYQREGKNAHDDAPDATTGIAEKIGQKARISFD